MRFMMILMAAVAASFSVYTLKQHGIEPASKDFWICQGASIAAGICVVLSIFPPKKKDGK